MTDQLDPKKKNEDKNKNLIPKTIVSTSINNRKMPNSGQEEMKLDKSDVKEKDFNPKIRKVISSISSEELFHPSTDDSNLQ